MSPTSCTAYPAVGPDVPVADGGAPAFARQRLGWLDALPTPAAGGADDAPMPALARRHLAELTAPGALPAGLRLAAHCMGEVHAASYRRVLQAAEAFDRRAALPALAVPTLVLAGAHDRLTPPDSQRALARALPMAQLQTLPVGHWPNLEAPDDFDALVLGFLAATPRPARHLQ